MPLVHPNVYVLKRPLPPGTMYVLKTESAREALDAASVPDLRFEIVYEDRQSYWKKSRDKLHKMGVLNVIELRFQAKARYCLSREWMKEGEISLLRIDIFAIPADIWKESKLTKEHVCKALQDVISLVTSRVAWDNPWRCDMQYLFQERILRCVAKFTAKRQSEEIVEWRIRS
jgi:hypothetical protein